MAVEDLSRDARGCCDFSCLGVDELSHFSPHVL